MCSTDPTTKSKKVLYIVCICVVVAFIEKLHSIGLKIMFQLCFMIRNTLCTKKNNLERWEMNLKANLNVHEGEKQ